MPDLSLRGLISPFLLLSPDEQLSATRAVRADRLIRKRLPKRAKKASTRSKAIPKKQRSQLAALLKSFQGMTPEQLNQLKQEFSQ